MVKRQNGECHAHFGGLEGIGSFMVVSDVARYRYSQRLIITLCISICKGPQSLREEQLVGN